MGFTYAWFRRERLMIAARCCGAMARLIDEATEFAKGRIVAASPSPKTSHPGMLADLPDRALAARLMTYRGGRGIDPART